MRVNGAMNSHLVYTDLCNEMTVCSCKKNLPVFLGFLPRMPSLQQYGTDMA